MKTGFPTGRPRKGELRPLSKRAEYAKAYRQRRIAEDPSYLIKLAQQQADWRAANLERSREIAQGVRLRRKMWQTTVAAKAVMH